ncbi:hypothetical protein B0A55_09031 [Friedmanniomyces simplex]|uniref:Zn(2)-C6 fungal-type domain-containing protein n=1 Tax=Friedmanniomyces simplex TaxID=329884 RepID=A0A4U0WYK4_9PEZI|nr:hypothetical protein B0A55_09031 [Friedmanniomyces simplex]
MESRAEQSSKPKKLQRISQACDLCHRRSIRCRPSAENGQSQCQNCYDFGVDCTYNRPSRRRRNPSLAHSSPSNILPQQQQPGAAAISPGSDNAKSQDSNPATSSNGTSASTTNGTGLPNGTGSRNGASNSNGTGTADGQEPDMMGAYAAIREGRRDDLHDLAWRAFALASQATIEHLIEVYIEIVYPLFPLFHVPTLRERLQQREHLTDRGFFASVMAACALAAARVRDGATSDHRHLIDSPEKASEIFFAAAQDAIGKDFSKAHGLGSMRACGLLAVTAIQYGQIRTMHEYLGKYMTLRAMQQCHDERYWPPGISVIEREERRRIYWSMYTFDIYTAVVFDGLMWSQETHSNVRYPAEINDEDLAAEPASPTDDDNWLRGWNFTTDLYRMLEHSVTRMRRHKALHNGRSSVTRLLLPTDMPDAQLMDNVLGAYYELPARFRIVHHPPATYDRPQALFAFQAANIQTTLQLVRMTLFSSSRSSSSSSPTTPGGGPTSPHDVDSKCYIAEQVLTTFHSIAPQYLRAISTPLVYHLGRIGRLLASVMEGLLCEQSYQRVRNLLVSMADLLQGLESGLQPTAGASSCTLLVPQQQQQQVQGLQSSGGVVGGGPLISQTQVNGHLSTPLSAMGLPTTTTTMAPLDEFQLPLDLVNGEVWPWPFEFGPDAQMPVLMGFDCTLLVPQQQQQQVQGLQSSGGVVGGGPLISQTQVNGHLSTPLSAMGLPTTTTTMAPLDEFQLPLDLVNGEVWPWPFEFGPDAQMPVLMGFE